MSESPLPDRADHDTEESWGEPPADDDDERLEAERPPHYDDR